MSAVCHGCGTPLPPSRGGQARKWCSERCRKRSCGDPCVDCGTRTGFGAEAARVAEPRCRSCAAAHRKVWTRQAIVAAIQGWATLYGDAPAAPDWRPREARRRLGDESRALRFEQHNGRFPSFMTVIDEFGTWNAAIAAAGFEPRANHGGGENVSRRRNQRVPA